MRTITLEEYRERIKNIEQLTRTVKLINREVKSYEWRKGGKKKCQR